MQFSRISLNWEPHLIKVMDRRAKHYVMVADFGDSFNSSLSNFFFFLLFLIFPQLKSADKLASVLVPVS